MPAANSIFAASDPFALTRAWLAEASETEPNDPNAIALATVDETGLPNVRTVLLKEIEDDAFLFYTNYESRKGREIEASGKAAFVMHWKTRARQVRVRGEVAREEGAKADAYFASRPLGSRLGAWASRQSQPLADRDTLSRRIEDAGRRFGENPPRPGHWGGFRLMPLEFEFWEGVEYRLHDRERWRRRNTTTQWEIERLFP